jgi:hypothetical protein
MVGAGVASALERFDDPDLLEEGKVNIISLDAVVDRFGSRWLHRRDQVYDHVERTLQRQIGLHGYSARISETDFLVAQPDLSRFAAQAGCLRCLREILGHFLGEAHLADHGVHEVTKVAPGAVEARQVDARAVAAAAAIEPAAPTPAPPAPPVAPQPAPALSVDLWSPFVAAGGQAIRVSCALEPVYELKTYGRIGFRLVRRVLDARTGEPLAPAEIANLARSDIIRIDMATIARGLERLSQRGKAERQPSVIIPVSYSSLASQRGRAQIVGAFKNARALVERGVICEIGDIEGAPPAALLDAVSLIRPFSLFIIGKLANPTYQVVAGLKDAGLQGLAIERRSDDERGFAEWAEEAVRAARTVVRSVLVWRAGAANEAAMAGVMGATHASVRAL